MSIELVLRYQKKDNYDHHVFIASNKYNEEKDAFEKLKNLEDKLKAMNLGTFLPVFHNDNFEYCIVRFKNFNCPVKLYERNLYTVKFVVKKMIRDGKEYINTYANNVKIYRKAKPQDTGEVLDMGI